MPHLCVSFFFFSRLPRLLQNNLQYFLWTRYPFHFITFIYACMHCSGWMIRMKTICSHGSQKSKQKRTRHSVFGTSIKQPTSKNMLAFIIMNTIRKKAAFSILQLRSYNTFATAFDSYCMLAILWIFIWKEVHCTTIYIHLNCTDTHTHTYARIYACDQRDFHLIFLYLVLFLLLLTNAGAIVIGNRQNNNRNSRE